MNRRSLILAGMGLLGAGYIGWLQLKETKGKVIGGGQGIKDGLPIYFLSVLDLNQKEALFLPVDFLPHGIAIDNYNKNRIIVFEKKGPGACEIDLLSLKVNEKIEPVSGQNFYGHGVFVKDKVLATETEVSTSKGFIVVRDSKTLKQESLFPTYGSNPHDCQLIADGTILAITNGGDFLGGESSPCVTYVEVSTQKLIEKFEISNERFNAGHLVVSKTNDLFVASAPRLGLPESEQGALSRLNQERKLKIIDKPKEVISKLKSETLSLAISEKSNLIAATSPKGNNVTFWHLKTGLFVKKIDIVNPRGVSLTKDESYFLISNGQDGGINLIDTKNLNSIHRIGSTGFSGSHLYTI